MKPHQKLSRNHLNEDEHRRAGSGAIALVSRREDGGSLSDELDYYLNNQKELAKEHEGKVLVIKNREVIGVYESKSEALNETVRNHKLGTFLVQACKSDLNSLVQTLNSRARMLGAESD